MLKSVLDPENNNMLRKICFKNKNYIKLGIAILLLAALLSGCSKKPYSIEASLGWKVSFSFPQGAPPLNREADMLCTIDTDRNINKQDLKIWIILPDALRLVSGNLEWEGDFIGKPGYKIPIVKARVRSEKVGNWEIKVCMYLPEGSQTLNDLLSRGYPVAYLSISENSANWRVTPPFIPSTTSSIR